ncbi:hypothetical protein KHQ81_00595 [Mycoplasmatota bacterium]|nr:hypothetical protein KHQ81_00595 [Mycoplasmatota bacterium]
MVCKCDNNDIISNGKEILEYKTNLSKLEVNSYKWRILFRCLTCGTFWEQQHYGGTYDEAPHLVKVSQEYVNENWGNKYFNN